MGSGIVWYQCVYVYVLWAILLPNFSPLSKRSRRGEDTLYYYPFSLNYCIAIMIKNHHYISIVFMFFESDCIILILIGNEKNLKKINIIHILLRYLKYKSVNLMNLMLKGGEDELLLIDRYLLSLRV